MVFGRSPRALRMSPQSWSSAPAAAPRAWRSEYVGRALCARVLPFVAAARRSSISKRPPDGVNSSPARPDQLLHLDSAPRAEREAGTARSRDPPPCPGRAPPPAGPAPGWPLPAPPGPARASPPCSGRPTAVGDRSGSAGLQSGHWGDTGATGAAARRTRCGSGRCSGPVPVPAPGQGGRPAAPTRGPRCPIQAEPSRAGQGSCTS